MDAESCRVVLCDSDQPELDLTSSETDQQGSAWRGRIKRYGPLVFWIGLIFFFSSGVASAAETSRIIRPILVFLFPSASEETLRQYHFFIRKCAHLTEYAFLAFWTIRALTRSSWSFLKKYRYLLAVMLVITVASLDEFHQSFEPSRTSTPWDVLLDTIGGTTMTLIYWLVARRR